MKHLGCSSLRSGGQEHYKVKQFTLKEKKMQMKISEINTILVSAAIHTCKSKTAAMVCKKQIGFLAYTGVNIGSIGHGH